MTTTLATIDLGSNSFHMLITRFDKQKRNRVLLRQKQQIKLRAGIDLNQHLLPETKQAALQCLQDFATNLKKYKVQYVKAIGTYTLRAINDPHFLTQAETALGFPITIISGKEEARLVYVGASLGKNISKNRHTLVVDIGGGSTELILGQDKKILNSCSIGMGCVGFQQQFFADELLSKTHFETAIAQARNYLLPFSESIQKAGWQHCLGSSGTIQTIASFLHAVGWRKGHIDKKGLELLLEKLLEVKKVSHIKFEGVRADRESILAGGLCILVAIFDVLNIQQMQLSPGGVREAILHELIEEIPDE